MAVLSVKEVSKSFDGEQIINKISMELHQGEIVSLLGVSGGGKTTLFNIIAGLSLPDEGSVWMDGEEITGKPGNVSYMLQKDLLLPYRTIVDNVALPLVIRGMKKKEAREKAARYFEEFGLAGTEKKQRLSGGWRIKYVPALDYYDPVFMAKRIKKAKVDIIRAGLGDYVCPPSGLAISYNNLATPDKTIRWYQSSDHGFVPHEKEIIVWSTGKK